MNGRDPSQRVVITGMGAVTPLGQSVETFWEALVAGTATIPSAWMRGRVATGSPTAFTAFTQGAVNGVGTAGGSLLLFQFSILGNNRRGTRTDALELQLDLTGRPTLTPGTYAGTLNIRAVAQ